MNEFNKVWNIVVCMVTCLALVPALALAKPSKCETCHTKISPKMVQDLTGARCPSL